MYQLHSTEYHPVWKSKPVHVRNDLFDRSFLILSNLIDTSDTVPERGYAVVVAWSSSPSVLAQGVNISAFDMIGRVQLVMASHDVSCICLLAAGPGVSCEAGAQHG